MKFNSIRRVGMILVLVTLPVFASAQPFEEGVHFERIDGPQAADTDTIVEVVEFFSYLCPHCYTFEPYVEPWHDELGENVEFKRVPVVFRPSWEPFARAYYAAEVLDIIGESHLALFKALHEERRQFRGFDDIAEFHAQFGVESDQFASTAQSFPVASRLRMGNANMGKWGVRSTPTLVIDGKWRVSPRRGGTFDEMLQVADWLIERELGQATAESGE